MSVRILITTFLLLTFSIASHHCQADDPGDESADPGVNVSRKVAIDSSLVQNTIHLGKMTAGTVVERMKSNLGVDWQETEKDGFKSGSPESAIRGITVTLFPTYSVLQQAVESGNNFVLCHGDPMYSGAASMTDEMVDPVVAAKQKLIDENKLVIYRLHDNIRKMKYNGIHRGMIEQLGWEDFRVDDSDERFEFSPIKIGKLSRQLAEQLDTQSVRVVGDPNQIVTKVAFSAGAWNASDQIDLLRRDDVQLLVVGEAREWRTVEYVRDAVDQGRDKSMILIGHTLSKEAGMKWCSDWVQGFVTEVPVEFVPSREPYWTPNDP